jgi:small subunit ribosomal protein S17
MVEQASSNPMTLEGKVVSNKMDKTIVVLVERRVRHQRYGKYITRSAKMHAHDANNECQIGDLVKISETRPYSKTKCWKLKEILRKSEARV